MTSIIDSSRVFAAAEISSLYRDDDRSIAEKYGHLCAPYFKIEISDKDDNILFSADSLLERGGFDLNGLIINDVSFEEDIDGASCVSITVNDPNVELLDNHLFDIGNNIDVWFGYDGRASFYMGRGIIVESAPNLPATEMPTIRITAYDILYFLMEEGKGEIVPEGSAWWERTQIRRTGRLPLDEPANDSYEDTLSEEEVEERIADNYRTQAADPDSYLQQLQTGMEAEEEGIDRSTTVIHGVTIPGDDVPVAPSRIQTTTGWQQQRLGRRRRQAGKVWRNLTDAEIVAKIFLSYGITPYVEATDERVRRVSARNRPSTRDSFDSTLSVTQRYGERDSIDSSESRGLTEEQIRRLEMEAEPDESLEEARERIGDGINDWETTGTDFDGAIDDLLNSDSMRDLEGGNAYNAFYRPGVGSGHLANLRENEYGELVEDDAIVPDAVIMEVQTPPDDTPPQMPTRTGEGGDRTVTQKSGSTDWEFIKELADKHGFIVFVFFHIESRRWIGYWGPEKNVPQYRQYIFRYNDGDWSTLGNVRPNVSAKGQATEIDLIFTDPVSRRENRLRVAMDNVNSYTSEFRGDGGPNSIPDPLGDGPEVTLAVHGQRIHVNANHRFTSAEDARIWLMAYWVKHAEDFALIDGNTIVGIPELRAREHHQFLGIGRRYSGKYFVTQARHMMSPNTMYTTEFTARRSSTLQPGDDNTEALTVDQREIGTNTIDDSEQDIVL